MATPIEMPSIKCRRKRWKKIIRDWITAILGPVSEAELPAVALCGTLQPHAAAIHLFALLDHKTRYVLSQQAVDCKTNEPKAALGFY